MRRQLFIALSVIAFLASGCDNKDDNSTLDVTIDKAFEDFSANYGVYKPEDIQIGKIFIRRLEWLETSDTYFIRFSLSPLEFHKLEQSAEYVLAKASLSQGSNDRTPRRDAPKWFIKEIQNGFKESLLFKKISPNKEIGEDLSLQVEVDTSNKDRYIIYLYCNYLLKW